MRLLKVTSLFTFPPVLLDYCIYDVRVLERDSNDKFFAFVLKMDFVVIHSDKRILFH